MAHYEMYFCLPSSAYDSAVGTKIKGLYPVVESVDETVTSGEVLRNYNAGKRSHK